jgi:hypothetical protein
MNTRKNLLILTGAIATALPAFGAEPTKEQLDFFESKIRPVLAERCYKCHSEQEGKSKGGLTLDTSAATLKGGDTGPGVVPGDIEKSLVYKAITYTDKDLEMPPSSTGGKLSDQQIADIAAWIKMGAPDPRKEAAKSTKLSGLSDKARAHWAYQPVKKRIKVPVNKNQAWCRTPIDAFILQKLEAKGMLPSPDAGAETLLRRGYFDLIGLPPSPAEVEAFVADYARDKFGAWSKVVDRLLASPHYGERWARHWLDSARYADTIGGDVNVNTGRADYRYPNAWTYRDYVVRALNEDKPYNQFIIEQLAADYLYPMRPVGSTPAVAKAAEKPVEKKPAPKKPVVADPFLLGKSGGSPVPAPAEPAPEPSVATPAPAEPAPAMQPVSMTMDNMMGGAGGGRRGSGVEMEGDPNLAALGFLTVGMRFNNANDQINDRIDVVTKAFLGVTVSCSRCHDHMFDPIPQSDYYALHGVFASSEEPVEKPLISTPSPELRAEYEKAVAAVEKENRDIYYREVEHWLSLYRAKPVEYLRAALLNGRRNEKNIVERQKLVEQAQLQVPFVNFFQRAMNSINPVFGPLQKFEDLGPGATESQAASVLQEIQRGGRYNPIVVKALVDAKPQAFYQALDVYKGLVQRFDSKAKYFVAAFKDATSEKVSGYTKDEIEFLSGPFAMVAAPKANTDWVREAIGGWNNQMTGRARFVFAKINELQLTNPGAPARAMVVVDRPSPQNSRLLIRGQAGTPGDVVPRGFLSILSPEGKSLPFTTGSGRLELAKAIASKDNPLTARVIINRVWLQHFGEGFIRTPDDIGVMSETPSHPELIDYLAGWFVDEKGGNWSLKALHKFVMNSRVYMASSYIIPGSKYPELDPDNRLLWRANVRRLDFEAIRDSLLVMSGRLDPKIGGQPVNITDEPYIYRRSIYGYIDRGNLPELMSHFDFSDPDMPNSKRATTIVPQQALFLMNSPLAVDVARRVIARSEFQRADNDLRRVFAIYRIMFQRQPKPRELEVAIDFIQKEKNKQKEVAAMADEIAKKNEEVQKRLDMIRNRDNDARRAVINAGDIVERKPLDAWETFAHSLLFANEAAYVN